MQIGQRPQLWQLQDQTPEDKGDGEGAQGYSPAPHNGRACGNKGDAVPNGCPLVSHRPATALPPRKSPPCALSPEPGRVGNSAVGGGSVGARLGGGERENRVWGFSLRCIVDTIGSSPMCGIQYSVHLGTQHTTHIRYQPILSHHYDYTITNWSCYNIIAHKRRAHRLHVVGVLYPCTSKCHNSANKQSEQVCE